MGTSLITGVKLWQHKGKEWRPPHQLVEAKEKGAFGSPSTAVGKEREIVETGMYVDCFKGYTRQIRQQ